MGNKNAVSKAVQQPLLFNRKIHQPSSTTADAQLHTTLQNFIKPKNNELAQWFFKINVNISRLFCIVYAYHYVRKCRHAALLPLKLRTSV